MPSHATFRLPLSNWCLIISSGGRMHVNAYVGRVTRSALPGGDDYPSPGEAALIAARSRRGAAGRARDMIPTRSD